METLGFRYFYLRLIFYHGFNFRKISVSFNNCMMLRVNKKGTKLKKPILVMFYHSIRLFLILINSVLILYFIVSISLTRYK